MTTTAGQAAAGAGPRIVTYSVRCVSGTEGSRRPADLYGQAQRSWSHGWEPVAGEGTWWAQFTITHPNGTLVYAATETGSDEEQARGRAYWRGTAVLDALRAADVCRAGEGASVKRRHGLRVLRGWSRRTEQ